MKRTEEESSAKPTSEQVAAQTSEQAQASNVVSTSDTALDRALATTIAAAQAPAVAQITEPAVPSTPASSGKKFEKVTVSVKVKNDICKLFYNVKNVINASSVTWNFVDQKDGYFIAVFEAYVYGQGYYRESERIPKDIKDGINLLFEGRKQDYYKIKLKNTGSTSIASYFDPKGRK